MAKDFKVKDGDSIRTRLCDIASATVVEAGDLVAISSGLIIKAVDGSAAIGYCPNGSVDGEVLTEVSVGNDFTLIGTGDAAFAVTYKGVEKDLVVTEGVQLIDVGTTSTSVLKVSIGTDAGVAASTDNIEVRINKPLF